MNSDNMNNGRTGRSQSYLDEEGMFRVRWLPEETVLGEPYHMMDPGIHL